MNELKKTGRWRRKGELTNAKCTKCLKEIWKRIDIHTFYHGKKYYDENNNVQSVLHINHGILCEGCFDREKNI